MLREEEPGAACLCTERQAACAARCAGTSLRGGRACDVSLVSGGSCDPAVRRRVVLGEGGASARCWSCAGCACHAGARRGPRGGRVRSPAPALTRAGLIGDGRRGRRYITAVILPAPRSFLSPVRRDVRRRPCDMCATSSAGSVAAL